MVVNFKARKISRAIILIKIKIQTIISSYVFLIIIKRGGSLLYFKSRMVFSKNDIYFDLKKKFN